jgi:PEP-CTERM motif
MNRLATLALAVTAALPAAADPISILFVGNSYTFGRLDPVLTYNAANVRDLTRPQGDLQAVDPTKGTDPKLPVSSNNPIPNYTGAPFTNVFGTNSYPLGMNNPNTGVQGNSYSPHTKNNSWGGVAGIFKQLTEQVTGSAYVEYDVALSTRNAATLRGHFLNTANSTNWDLRGNISSQSWDKMILQEQSDEALGPNTVDGVALGSNFPSIRAYVDLIEDWVHTGRPVQAGVMTNNTNNTTYRERNMYYLGGTTSAGGAGGQYANEAACVAAGGTPSVTVNGETTSGSCANNALRTIPNNTKFSAATEIYLQQTWARPNLINAPRTATIDPVTGNASYPETNPLAPSYFSTLEAMTADMTTGMLRVADYANDDGTSGIKDIIPVGQAFLTAVQAGFATRDMYGSDAESDGLIDLWFNDGTHASVAGSYLSALTNFGAITGLDPAMFGARERAAADLGLSERDALRLQAVASYQLGFRNSVPEPGSLALAALALLGVAGLRRRVAPASGSRA